MFVSWQGYPATDSELRKIFDGLDVRANSLMHREFLRERWFKTKRPVYIFFVTQIKVIRPCPTQSSAYIDFNTMDSMISALAKDGKVVDFFFFQSNT